MVCCSENVFKSNRQFIKKNFPALLRNAIILQAKFNEVILTAVRLLHKAAAWTHRVQPGGITYPVKFHQDGQERSVRFCCWIFDISVVVFAVLHPVSTVNSMIKIVFFI